MSPATKEQLAPLAQWQIKTEVMLTMLAEKAELMSYDELATSVEVPAPHRIHKLTTYLERLIEEDIKKSAPIRAAVIISKVRGIPAPGFFDKIAACDVAITTDPSLFHHSLLARLNPAFQS